MAYNGSGQFDRLHDWTDDRDGGVKIRADRMDDEMDGMATGLSTCVTKDGQTVPTANLPMGGFKHTNVANASARNHYAAAGQVQDGALFWAGTDIGAADAYEFSLTPSITAYAAGQEFRGTIGAGNTNTGASTVKFDALTAKNVKMIDGEDPPAGAILAGRSHSFLYDGTDFVLLDPALNQNAAFESGTRMLFQQSSAPTGWTKDTTANLHNTAIRLVTGNVGSETGQQSFTAMHGKTSTDGFSLSETHLGSHDHNTSESGHRHGTDDQTQNRFLIVEGTVQTGRDVKQGGANNLTMLDGTSNSLDHTTTSGTASATTGISINNAGSGSAHSHGADTRINRHDVIAASKD